MPHHLGQVNTPSHTHLAVSAHASNWSVVPATPSLVTLKNPFLASVSRFAPPPMGERTKKLFFSELSLSLMTCPFSREIRLAFPPKVLHCLDFPHTKRGSASKLAMVHHKGTNVFCFNCSRITLLTLLVDGLHVSRAFCWFYEGKYQTDNTHQEDEQLRNQERNVAVPQKTSCRMAVFRKSKTTIFFLKHSLFLPLGACLRSQDPGLDELAFGTSPRFYTGFLDQRLFKLSEGSSNVSQTHHIFPR